MFAPGDKKQRSGSEGTRPLSASLSPIGRSPLNPFLTNQSVQCVRSDAVLHTTSVCGLTDDDLADFPDELCSHARVNVSVLLLQALMDVRTLDQILYSSLLWMLNNDITDVIDETFSVSVPGTDKLGELS